MSCHLDHVIQFGVPYLVFFVVVGWLMLKGPKVRSIVCLPCPSVSVGVSPNDVTNTVPLSVYLSVYFVQ